MGRTGGAAAHRRTRRLPNSVAPPPRSRIPNHPPYAEMVQMALRSLEEDGGSTEASLSRFIRSAYSGLPPAHSSFLPYYLRKLLAAGEISLLSSDHYTLPQNPPNTNPQPALPQNPLNPNPSTTTVHRGRGRPRKHVPFRALPADHSTGAEPTTRPRLIIRLRRKTTDSETRAVWYCLEEGEKGECHPLGFEGRVETAANLEMDPKSNNGPSKSNEEFPPTVSPDSEHNLGSPELQDLPAEKAPTTLELALVPVTSTTTTGKKKGYSDSRKKPQTKGRRLWYEGQLKPW